MCPIAFASVGADNNGGIDLKPPSWHRFLHALPAPVRTFPDSHSVLFNFLRHEILKCLGFGVRKPELNSQF